MAAEGMAAIVEPEVVEAGVLKTGLEVVVHQIGGIDNGTSLRRENKVLSDARLSLHKSGEHSFVAKFEQNAAQFAENVYPSHFLILRRSKFPVHVIVPHKNISVGILLADSELDVAPTSPQSTLLGEVRPGAPSETAGTIPDRTPWQSEEVRKPPRESWPALHALPPDFGEIFQASDRDYWPKSRLQPQSSAQR
jgi:hypothetical protein